MRVFLDTNVLVAAFAARGLCEDLFRHVLTNHELVIGETVLHELQRILRTKLAIPASQADEIVTFVRLHAEVIAAETPAQWPANDPDDQWVVAAAIEGRAEVLVTGDRDLLEAVTQIPVRVATPRDFWEMLT